FDAVEFWWPFEVAVPNGPQVDTFVRAITEAGVALTGLNFFAGDMPRGDRGLVSWPGRAAEFAENTAVVAQLGERLGCTAFNALYGNRVAGTPEREQDELAVENLRIAADAVAGIGGTVLLEPVSGAPRYPLRTAADALGVIDAVGKPNVGLLADLYHLAENGDDIDTVIAQHTDRIAHVQVADSPGRHEPGTGSLEIPRYLRALAARGYTGYTGLEYRPGNSTVEGLSWLPFAQRAATSQGGTA
ncbi:MAG: hydroxypyruvate isomerase family protein, partial [Sciscionella sp.]